MLTWFKKATSDQLKWFFFNKTKNAYTEIDLEFSFINPDLHYPFPFPLGSVFPKTHSSTHGHANGHESTCSHAISKDPREASLTFAFYVILKTQVILNKESRQLSIYLDFNIFLANDKNQSIFFWGGVVHQLLLLFLILGCLVRGKVRKAIVFWDVI